MDNGYTIFDAHCDTISELLDHGQGLYDNDMQFSLRQTEGYAGYVQVFAAWIDTEKYPRRFARACAIIDKLKSEIAANAQRIAFADSYDAVRGALAGGKAAAMLSVEDGAALDGDIDNLYRLHDRGVRFLTLTWNGRNELGDGVMVPDGGGLTAFGRAVVREMGALGMAVDVSHLSERGFWDVMELDAGPVCATHSNAKAVCGHPRNLTDAQFRAIAQAGGVVGVNVYDKFVTDGGPCGVPEVYRHIAHFMELDGGAEHIGIGTDFDGMESPAFQIRRADEIVNLVEYMQKQGADRHLVDFITHGSFMQFVRKKMKK